MSVADPHHVDAVADSDPIYHVDADPNADPDPDFQLLRIRKVG